MSRAVHAGDEDFRILNDLEPSEPGVVEFFDAPSAVGFLQRLLVDPRGHAVLRDLVADDPAASDASLLDDHAVVETLAWHLLDRRLRVVRLPRLVLGATGERRETAPPPGTSTAPETTWIEFKIIDDRTNEPIPGIKLNVTLPDGSKAPHTTDGDGLITIDPLTLGSCGLSGDDDDLSFARTLEFVGIDERVVDETQEKPEKLPSPLRIASVEHHKVRQDETLDSLAKAVGKTWKDLARFNFGTDEPAKINAMLAAHVGCTKRTKDRKNYRFTDADDPGILYIPRRWERRGLSTGFTHVFRVRPIVRVTRPFVFSY